jgi:undecaprenyl-diphosphatase
VKLLFYHSTDSSFPSNAATLAFVIAFVILFYNKRAGFFALALSFYLGFSRIAAGIHYPLDIAGGILLGFSCATFSRSLENLYEPITKTLTNTIARLMGSVPGAGKEKSAWEK